MASWPQLQAHVREAWRLDRDDAHAFALTLPRGTGSDRAQRLMVRAYEAWGQQMIEVRSAFGEYAGGADRLLDESLALPLGAISRHGRFLVLVQKACLDHLSIEGAVFLIVRLGRLADVLEERSGADRF